MANDDIEFAEGAEGAEVAQTEAQARRALAAFDRVLHPDKPCIACARGKHAECDVFINEGAVDAQDFIMVGCSCYDGDRALHDDLRHPRERVEWSDIISVSEAAKTAGVSMATMRRMCEDGRVRARKVGKEWVVERGSVPLPKTALEDVRDRCLKAERELGIMADAEAGERRHHLRSKREGVALARSYVEETMRTLGQD